MKAGKRPEKRAEAHLSAARTRYIDDYPQGRLNHADARVVKLDELRWTVRFEPYIIPAKDPLEGMDRFGEAE